MLCIYGMVSQLIEPMFAGLFVSLFNKYVLNPNSILYKICQPTVIETFETEDCISSQNTAISDVSLETPHIHIHS